MVARRIAFTTAMLVLAGTGSAQAAAPWTTRDIGPRANGSEAIGVAFSPLGTGLLGWRLGQSSYVARLRGDGTLGHANRLAMELVAGPVAPTGPASPAAPRASPTPVILRRIAPGSGRPCLGWALVRRDGTVGPVMSLATSRCLTWKVKLAVNSRGDAVVAWRDEGGTSAAYRPAGGSFSTPVRVFRAGNDQYPDVSAAISADGRALVVHAGELVRARVRTRGGSLGRAMTAGRGNGSVRATAAFSNGGDAIVAWGSQDGGEEANAPWVFRAARLRRGAKRFAAVQTLDAGSARARPEGRVALAFIPGGRATVAWSAVGPRQTFPVMSAAAPNGGRFGPPQQLAPSGAVGAVAVRADGSAVVAWSRLVGSQQPVGVFASVRPAGAVTFGAPEAVAAPDNAFFPPVAAFDPVSGRPTIAWGSRPEPPSPDGVVDDSIMHVATRAAP